MTETFAEYQARTHGGAAGGSTGGTTNKTSETTSSVGLGNDFSLGTVDSSAHFGIGDDRYNIPITNSVGLLSLPAEQLAMLQAQMVQAGLTPSTYLPSGTLDDETRAGLLELKRTASATGTSDVDTLRTMIQTKAQAAAGTLGGGSGDGGSAGSKQIIEPQFTDPLTARGVLLDAMTQRLGRAPTSDEYHQFRHLLSNAEGGQDVVTQTPVGTDKKGRTITRVTRSDNTTDPSATDVADDYLSRGKLGREANTVRAADYFDIIARKVGGI